ncbi:hypothetical protein GGC63_003898 [Paenibacillus sp. OAS669]|nr:hypothetical protein [Paenibacillus sp. OAS669]
MMTRDLLAYLAGVPCFLFRAAIDQSGMVID